MKPKHTKSLSDVYKLRLFKIWEKALAQVCPKELFGEAAKKLCPPSIDEAFLFWGKAAVPTWKVLSPLIDKGNHSTVLVIGTDSLQESDEFQGLSHPNTVILGDHPLPGPRSFEAGFRIVEYFDLLRTRRIKRLTVHLSGGASSLAWLRPAELSAPGLMLELNKLYRSPLSIEDLNQKRASFCLLKGGGAADWLHFLAPEVHASVEVISDVAPFGVEVVGSGPFFNKRIPHRVVADNLVLLKALAQGFRQEGEKVLALISQPPSHWQKWVSLVESEMRKRINHGERGVVLIGGEPLLRLHPKDRSGPRAGKGGRQSQIAAALLLLCEEALQKGQMEILCMSSDGVDGLSGSAGAMLTSDIARRLTRAIRMRLKKDVEQMNSAASLKALGALIPAKASGTNVQDVVILRFT